MAMMPFVTWMAAQSTVRESLCRKHDALANEAAVPTTALAIAVAIVEIVEIVTVIAMEENASTAAWMAIGT
jgi:hypothetical protein